MSPKTSFINKNIILFFAIFVFILYLFLRLSPMDSFLSNSNEMIEIYEAVQNRMSPKLLETIYSAKYQPKNDGKTIFFVVTHKMEDKVLKLSKRQACSIEAAGKFV